MDSVRLDNKTVVITGANAGVGKGTAIAIARRGARVILACRSAEKAEAARQEIVDETGNENIEFRPLDLASLQSVREFAEQYNNEEARLDILICNAGVVLAERKVTVDGFEMTFGVNHLGHFLLTNLLLEKLKASAPSRIVVVSSKGHEQSAVDFDDLQSERNYKSLGAYERSKTCNILFAVKLSKLLAGTGVTTYALHPGLVESNIASDATCMDNGCIRCCVFRFFSVCYCMPLLNIHDGARTSLYCSLEPSIANDSGRYYSDSREKAAKPHATDMETADRLWSISEELCGLK